MRTFNQCVTDEGTTWSTNYLKLMSKYSRNSVTCSVCSVTEIVKISLLTNLPQHHNPTQWALFLFLSFIFPCYFPVKKLAFERFFTYMTICSLLFHWLFHERDFCWRWNHVTPYLKVMIKSFFVFGPIWRNLSYKCELVTLINLWSLCL